jgi:threonine efflux protein
MEPISLFATIALVHLLAIASPGPTFVVITRYAVAGDRRAGFQATCGALLATFLWASLAAAGLGIVIAGFGWLAMALRIVGAVYLAWLGVKMLKTAWTGSPAGEAGGVAEPTGWRAVRAGFITNISNPKVVAYYASLFTVVIPPDAPVALLVGAMITAVAVSAVWWSLVTLFFALPAIRQGYRRIRRTMDAAMGVILIALGGRLLFSR